MKRKVAPTKDPSSKRQRSHNLVARLEAAVLTFDSLNKDCRSLLNEHGKLLARESMIASQKVDVLSLRKFCVIRFGVRVNSHYSPGSKSEALRLGVHLILLHFIKFSLLIAETFLLFED